VGVAVKIHRFKARQLAKKLDIPLFSFFALGSKDGASYLSWRTATSSLPLEVQFN
jgi:hypothetical protein